MAEDESVVPLDESPHLASLCSWPNGRRDHRPAGVHSPLVAANAEHSADVLSYTLDPTLTGLHPVNLLYSPRNGFADASAHHEDSRPHQRPTEAVERVPWTKDRMVFVPFSWQDVTQMGIAPFVYQEYAGCTPQSTAALMPHVPVRRQVMRGSFRAGDD